MALYNRTHTCGSLRSTDLQKTVTICGWIDRRRDHGHLTFLDVRDRSGIVQVVAAADQQPNAHMLSQQVRAEYVVHVTGTVVARSSETINTEIATGHVEIQAEQITILNRCKTLPFPLDDAEQVDEETRLTYRYLDLRRPEVHKRFKIRHQVIAAMRDFLDKQGFYEIETPILTKNTAEGAREFLVPSRVHKGQFYALPQSPQIYKQLLMAGGMERYFQVARCFRDEDLRADRQPEFTQLDIEMAFIHEEDIQQTIELLLAHVLEKVFNFKLALPLARMPYSVAMHRYGSDKPDIRFDLPIYDITPAFADTQLAFLKQVLANSGKIGALCVPNTQFTRSELEQWVNTALKNGAQGLVWIRYQNGLLEAPIAKFLPTDFIQRVQQSIPEFGEGSTLFIIAGAYQAAWTQLGRLRLQLAHALNMIPHDQLSFHWVVDFPLLEYDTDRKAWSSVHHPFTSPQEGWEQQEPGAMKARAYDIVFNGVELGGGSIRIHTPDVQQKIFDFLGFDKDLMQQHFGFLLQAQEFGFPPHGGIALGLDRFIMLMLKCQSIRDVIAFPKTQTGMDPLLQAPTPVADSKLADYDLKIVRPSKKPL